MAPSFPPVLALIFIATGLSVFPYLAISYRIVHIPYPLSTTEYNTNNNSSMILIVFFSGLKLWLAETFVLPVQPPGLSGHYICYVVSTVTLPATSYIVRNT